MKRLFVLAFLVLILGWTSCPQAANPEYVLKIAHAQPEGDFAYHQAATVFKDELAKLTDGKVAVEIYPGGQLGTDFNVIKKVQNGGVDGEIMAIQLLGAYFPPIDIYSLPFMFKDFDSFIRLRNSDFHKQLMEEMQKKTGLVTPAFVGFSFRDFTTSNRPINSVEDMKGLKLRMNQNKVSIATCEALGANAIAMPAAEVFSALQQGVVDGQDATLNFASSQKYYEVQKNLAQTVHQLSGSCMILNEKKLNKLPQEMREAVMKAAAKMEEVWQKRSIEEEGKLIDLWRDKGVNITNPPLEPFVEAVKPVYEQFAGTLGGMGKIEEAQRIASGK